jgi:hypothetical protein
MDGASRGARSWSRDWRAIHQLTRQKSSRRRIIVGPARRDRMLGRKETTREMPGAALGSEVAPKVRTRALLQVRGEPAEGRVEHGIELRCGRAPRVNGTEGVASPLDREQLGGFGPAGGLQRFGFAEPH